MRMLSSLLFLLAYIIPRFVAPQSLRFLGPYGSYIYEFFFFVVTALWYRKRFKLFDRADRTLALHLLFSIFGGFAVYKLAVTMGLAIPFDLKDDETLLFLLLVGPVVEELIFRQALWWPAQDLAKTKWLPLAVTSVLFAFGHFHAYFFVSATIKPFVVYQTVYALFIAVWWGWALMRWRGLMAPLSLHMVFNAGFYLASLI
jgi:membrane protease YdiL (CAAX protease family)